jgi:hypothetical protein
VRTRPLSELSSRDLRPLLDEESEHWGNVLQWDFREVSAAVASGLDRRTLAGRALQDGSRFLAYAYYMLDTGRAIVGSLFAASPYRGQDLEETLLDAVLADAQGRPGSASTRPPRFRATTSGCARCAVTTSRPRPGSSTRATWGASTRR